MTDQIDNTIEPTVPPAESPIEPTVPPADNPIDVIEFAKQSVRDELNPQIEDLKKRNQQLEYLLKNTTNVASNSQPPTVDEPKKINYVKWH